MTSKNNTVHFLALTKPLNNSITATFILAYFRLYIYIYVCMWSYDLIKSFKIIYFYLREKKTSRAGALKVLDHSMIGPEGHDNCHKFVDILGLRTIFPLFMKTPKKMKKAGISEKEHEGIFHLNHFCNSEKNIYYRSILPLPFQNLK